MFYKVKFSGGRTFLVTFILFLAFSSLNISVKSQVTQEWAQRYNGPGNGFDAGYVMAIDGNENIYVAGSSAGSGTGLDIITIKYDNQGSPQWVQRYNGSGNQIDVATTIYVDVNSYVYVAGYSFASSYDYVIIKYSPDGTVQWIQTYNGPVNGDDRASGVAVSSNGDVYVTGSSYGLSGYDIVTVKYNSSGIQQWVIRYDDPFHVNDLAAGCALYPSGGIYVAGTAYNGQNYDIIIIKYDASGNSPWQAYYNGTGNGDDGATALKVDNSGNVYVTGYTTGIGTGRDYVTLKYNNSGSFAWATPQNGLGNGYDVAKAIALDNSGNVLVTGVSYGNGTGYDIATCKYTNAGSLQWIKRYNSLNVDDNGTCIATDVSGSVYVGGTSNMSGAYTDYVTIKYNSVGVQNWVTNYNGPVSNIDSAFAICVGLTGNVYVTGTSSGGSSGYDIATIRYSQVTGIINTGSGIPEKYDLSQNYPNPFNPVTKIDYQLPIEGFTNITIYDILGREISAPVSEFQKAGKYTVAWDGSNYPSGTYFYRFTSGDYSDTKKLILVR
ncbi:MAG: T9SS type A sorting domain-containing protein [Ignavibacteria bacterium]